jgi:hypothetical protein
MIHNIGDTEYVHIAEFAYLVGKSVSAIRYLILHGNIMRKMKSIREGSKFYIPLSELAEFPFIVCGKSSGVKDIFHYQLSGTGAYVPVLCEECTYKGGHHGKD